LAISFIGLIFFALPIAFISFSIKMTSRGPIIFSQLRVGKNGKLFRLYKFRTMKVDLSPSLSITIAGDKRITSFGRFLRKWKVDEIPQLWNIIRGQMSLVGPRPDVPGYADRLKGTECRILDLRPGITGPATIKYANEEEILAEAADPVKLNDEVIFPDKVRMNLDYMKNCTFLNDVRYLLQTFGLILKKH